MLWKIVCRFFCFLILFENASLLGISAGSISITLDFALSMVNPAGGSIEFDGGDVNLTDQVRAIQSDPTFTFVPDVSIIIEGMGQALNGSGVSNTRGFFAGGRIVNPPGPTGDITINDLNFINCKAVGGDGGSSGGGGGLVLGGACLSVQILMFFWKIAHLQVV